MSRPWWSTVKNSLEAIRKYPKIKDVVLNRELKSFKNCLTFTERFPKNLDWKRSFKISEFTHLNDKNFKTPRGELKKKLKFTLEIQINLKTFKMYEYTMQLKDKIRSLKLNCRSNKIGEFAFAALALKILSNPSTVENIRMATNKELQENDNMMNEITTEEMMKYISLILTYPKDENIHQVVVEDLSEKEGLGNTTTVKNKYDNSNENIHQVVVEDLSEKEELGNTITVKNKYDNSNENIHQVVVEDLSEKEELGNTTTIENKYDNSNELNESLRNSNINEIPNHEDVFANSEKEDFGNRTVIKDKRNKENMILKENDLEYTENVNVQNNTFFQKEDEESSKEFEEPLNNPKMNPDKNDYPLDNPENIADKKEVLYLYEYDNPKDIEEYLKNSNLYGKPVNDPTAYQPKGPENNDPPEGPPTKQDNAYKTKENTEKLKLNPNFIVAISAALNLHKDIEAYLIEKVNSKLKLNEKQQILLKIIIKAMMRTILITLFNII